MMAKKFGIGEVYRIKTQIQLIDYLKKKFQISKVYEFPIEPISSSFSLNWKQVENPNVGQENDLMFTWRAFPHICKKILNEFHGNLIMFMATNKANLGVFFQRFLWDEPEVYFTKKELKKYMWAHGLTILKSGYYDSPLWPDMPLPRNVHVGLTDSWFNFEQLPLHYFRAHHVYAVGERK